MLATITKWKVDVTFIDRNVALWVHNNHLANVLRQLADLQFTERGLDQPTSITIQIVGK